MATLCNWCGWGIRNPCCATSGEAMACALNQENVRKFLLRHRTAPMPTVVRSVRYQGNDGKGDSYEFLEWVE